MRALIDQRVQLAAQRAVRTTRHTIRELGTLLCVPRKISQRTNPFVYSRPVVPGEAIERADEVALLLERAEQGHNATLYAPRRTGKTSLIKQLAAAAQARKMPSVVVDLSDVLSIADVSERLLQAFQFLPLMGSNAFWDPEVRRRVGLELASRDRFARPGPPDDPTAAVRSLLEVPGQVAGRDRKRVLVVLDDFDALSDLEGVDALIHGPLQDQQNVSWLFCVSEPRSLRSLFEDPARPFYGQDQITLERIPFAAAHDFIARQFDATDKQGGEAPPELLRLSELHPQRLMSLAHYAWNRAGNGAMTMAELRLACDDAMRSVDQELRNLWEGLTINERRVLAAVASGLSPYMAKARAKAGLASASSAQPAVATLLGRAFLERRDNALRMVDPLFARWIRLRAGARLNVYLEGPRYKGPQHTVGARQYAILDPPGRHAGGFYGDLDVAVQVADQMVVESGHRGGDVMIYDSDDRNDYPWTGLDVAGSP